MALFDFLDDGDGQGWRSRLHPASFRGVPFYVESTDAGGGRRVSVRELAGQDGSINQDHGEHPRSFEVEAFVWGDDFDIDRNDLEKALLTKGPGPLVLPTRGELTVTVTAGPFTTESRSKQGYCTIRFSVVVESEDEPDLKRAVDTAGALSAAAAVLKAIATANFASVFNVLALPGRYITMATNAVAGVTRNLRGIQAKIDGTLNPIETLTGAINDLDLATSGLLSTPDQLAGKLSGLTSSIFGLANTAASGLDRITGIRSIEDAYSQSQGVRTTQQIARQMAGLGADEPEGADTALADRSAKNVRAVYQLARVTALASAAENYADGAFESATLALSVLEDAMLEIGDLQEYSASDELFQSLADLRAALAAHLTQTAADLPLAQTLTIYPEVPAILLAHELYGDALREGEIVARNLPQHPLFMSGAIEVVK